MVDNNEKKWFKEFTKCPCCGSEKRFFETLGKELKERGLVKEDMKFYLDIRSGPLANQDVIQKLPIGSEIPAFGYAEDICLECGCRYAVRVEKLNAKKGITPIQFKPNRAQRRQGMQGGQGFRIPPQFGNPKNN